MKLDPRTTLFLYCAAAGAAVATNAPAPLLALLLGALATLVAARGLRRWLRVLALLAPLLVLLALLSALAGGPRAAVAPPLKLLLLGTLSAALFARLGADELGDALALLRLPPGVAFVLVGGLRYAPAVAESWGDLRDALRARGVAIAPGLRGLPGYGRLLVPAVVRALRTADDLAEAMEARGFGAPDATLPTAYRLRARDWLLLALAAIGLALYLAWLWRGGW
jgi:energy-coupling factor transport system permease protein